MKKVILALNIVLFSAFAMAQSVSGEWVGTLTQETDNELIPTEYLYFLTLSESDGQLTGTSKIVVKSTGDNVTYHIDGSAEGNAVNITEADLVNSKLKKGFFWCNKAIALTLDGDLMTGTWSSTYCGPGEIKLHRRVTEKVDLSAVKKDAKLVLRSILFETGSDKIDPSSYPMLEDMINYLATNKDMKLHIEGHTDNTGSDETNDILSLGRATSVVTYLVNGGISKDRLEAEGKGSHDPISTNNTEEGRAENRRIEFTLM